MKNNIKRKLIIFLALAFMLILIAVFAEYLCPFDPYVQDLSIAKQPPNLTHLLGTDRYGRDMLSRIIIGSKSSIIATLFLVSIITVFGTLVGVVGGYFGGKLDTVLMRISDLFLAFPNLVFALAVAGVMGGGIHNAVIALAIISWPKFARLSRSLTIAEKENIYIYGAKISGCSDFKIILYHIVPNIAGQILITAVLDCGTMMMEIAGLSFLGLGAKPPMAEWGSMMSDGRSMLQTVPWVILAPGGAIFLTVVIFNLLGDTLRDYLDPRQK